MGIINNLKDNKRLNKVLDYKSILLFFSVFLLTFLVYLSTLARSIVSLGDAPEFVVAVLSNGIPHPSGYPLFVILGKLATLIPLSNKVMLINGVSALFGGLTSGFVSLVVYRISKSFPSGFIAGLILGFSLLFWKYSVVSEVFILNAFFASILIYLSLTLTSRARYYALGIFAGLSLANHLTIILIFPGTIYLIWKQKDDFMIKDHIISGVIVLLFGLAPYSYLWWAGMNFPLQNWGNTNSFRGIAEIMIRKNYGVTNLSVGNVPEAIFIDQIFNYVFLTSKHFLYVGVALFIIGIYDLFQNKRIKLIALLTSFFLSGIVFILYSRASLGDVAYIAISERFLILSEVILVIFIGIGIAFFLKRFFTYRYIIAFSLLVLPAFLLFQNYTIVEQKNNNFTYNLADDIFSTTPEGTLLLVRGDAYYSSILYAYLIDKKRQDLAIVFPAFFTENNINQWYKALVGRHFPDIVLPNYNSNQTYEDYLNSVINANIENRPVVCACGYSHDNLESLSYRSIGLTDKFTKELGDFRLKSEEDKIDNKIKELKNTNPILIFPPSNLENEILTFYSRPYVKLSDLYGVRGDLDNAERSLLKAIGFSPQSYNLYIPLTNIYLIKGETQKAVEALENYMKANPYGELSNVAQDQLTKLKNY